jgi:hypothetical protein
MDWKGGFVQGSEGVMNTRAGQHHKMKLAEVQPGRFFALETRVVPGTVFHFNCRVEPAADGKTKISQGVEVRGSLGPILERMMGPQVSKEFGILLANLARKAEAVSSS